MKKNMKKDTKINLKDSQYAIVINEDETIEVYLPNDEDLKPPLLFKDLLDTALATGLIYSGSRPAKLLH